MKKANISVNGKTIHIVFGQTIGEWMDKYEQDGCWDFPFEELVDGTIEPNEDIWYWYIDGRFYETTENV